MTSPTAIGAILLRQDLCRAQGHPHAYWARKLATNGAVQIQYWCDQCARNVTRECYDKRGPFVSADWLETTLGIRAAELPELRLDLRYRRCQRCHTTALCEDHHWAPQAVFTDADDWPIGPLCAECHLRFTSTLETYIRRREQSAVEAYKRGGRAA
jgi:hypothetical protein